MNLIAAFISQELETEPAKPKSAKRCRKNKPSSLKVDDVLDNIISNELGLDDDQTSQDTTQDSDSEWLPAGNNLMEFLCPSML